MVREPFFTSLLGVFALIFKDPDNIILANMVLCHCLFVLTVVRLSNSFDMSKMAVTILASVAILGFGLIDLIIVPMAEGWQMIFMGQLCILPQSIFFKKQSTNKHFLIITMLITLMLLNRFGHSLFFSFALSSYFLIYFRKDKVLRYSIVKLLSFV